jgi:hypothetical protein
MNDIHSQVVGWHGGRHLSCRRRWRLSVGLSGRGDPCEWQRRAVGANRTERQREDSWGIAPSHGPPMRCGVHQVVGVRPSRTGLCGVRGEPLPERQNLCNPLRLRPIEQQVVRGVSVKRGRRSAVLKNARHAARIRGRASGRADDDVLGVPQTPPTCGRLVPALGRGESPSTPALPDMGKECCPTPNITAGRGAKDGCMMPARTACSYR